ncbi:hypothetical protein GCM10018980_40010 [Streptomyces capoamus]|uniref:Uncharacterized protein n=1 Tax=Streptomyces capoamus TaxID=68183 RepID=A0A919C825_9ACTN|nr:hypothetical protein GCM10010501_26180 [Streptomyces libani subsp. rufus]GHG54949.1 hypothetical protein GCM10018980_40010 [Streptomyces capoamus]
MSIISRPNPAIKTARCVICRRSRPFSALTAGFRDADGQQRFACDSHLVSDVIKGWAEFIAKQRQIWQRDHDKGMNYESPLY